MLSPVFGSKKGPFFILAHGGGEQTSGKQLLVQKMCPFLGPQHVGARICYIWSVDAKKGI